MIWIQDLLQMHFIVNIGTWSNPASCVVSFWICDEFVSRSRSLPGVPNDLSGNDCLDIYSTVPLKQAMVSSPLSVVTCHGINKSWGGRVHLPDPREEREILPADSSRFRTFFAASPSNFFGTTVAAALVAKNRFFPAAKEAEKNAHLTRLSRASAAWIFIKIHQPRFGMKCWAGF